MPVIRQRMCYTTVCEEQTKVCYRPVYRTVMKECQHHHLQAVLRAALSRRALHRLPAGDGAVRRARSATPSSRPVTETCYRECRYTVQKPVWQEYQVPVHCTTYHPVHETHYRECLLHRPEAGAGRNTRCRCAGRTYRQVQRNPLSRGLLHGPEAGAGRNTRCRCAGPPIGRCMKPTTATARYTVLAAGVAGIPGAGDAGPPIARSRKRTSATAVHRLQAGDAAVPGAGARTRRISRSTSSTRCQVPETCYRTVTEPRQCVFKTCVYEPVWTEKCYKVCTGEWKEEKVYCPGPVVRADAAGPPASGSSTRAPAGRTGARASASPTACRRRAAASPSEIWCPKEEIRTVRCCQMVPREQCQTITYHVCRQVPVTVMKPVTYTTCRMVPQTAPRW